MIKNKKIYLKAYFRKNLGDDMFVRCIAQRFPDASFGIYTTSAYAQSFESIPNINNCCYLERLIDSVCRKLTGKQIFKERLEKKADATVHIGGSIFIEPEHFVMPRNYSVNPNLFIIGCNFGPYRTEVYRDYIFSSLQKAKDVCFRDKYSYNIFSSLEKSRVAPDVLFGYCNYPAWQCGCGVGISVICLDERSDLKHMTDRYYNVIAQTVDYCVHKMIPVKLFSFCSDEGDKKAIKAIMDRSETKGAKVCEYDGNIDSMLREINSCEYIVATRFHAMIIGWCLSKKVVPVVYSDKQLHVMDDVGYQGACWDLRKDDGYTASDLLLHTLSATRMNCIGKYKKQSQNQFEKLDYYLKQTGKDDH